MKYLLVVLVALLFAFLISESSGANPSFKKYLGKTARDKLDANESKKQKALLSIKPVRSGGGRHQQQFEQIVMAMQNKDAVLTEELLKKDVKAPLFADTRDGKTLVHIACMFSNNDALELLIKHNAPIAASDDQGFTPIFMCSAQGNLLGVNLLLDAGVPVDGDTKICSPLVEALRRYWLFNSMLHKQPVPGGVLAQHSQVAELLIERGSNPHQKCEGMNPITLATQHRAIHVLKKLLAAGFGGINDQCKGSELMADKGTALHAAASSSAVIIGLSKILVRHGNAGRIPPPGKERKDVPIHDSWKAWGLELPEGLSLRNGTTFDRAIFDSMIMPWNNKFAVALLEHGADVNVKDIDGNTPLHVAAYQGELPMIEAMLKHGAQINVTNKYGETVLDMARKQARLKALEMLVGHRMTGDVEIDAEKFGIPLGLYKLFAGVRSPSKVRGILQPVPENWNVTRMTDEMWGGEGRGDLDIDFCDIEQVDVADMPPKKFEKEYLQKQKPLIIKNALYSWPAFKKWTPSQLRKMYGNIPFPIFRNKEHGEDRMSFTMTMSKYLDYMQKEDGADKEPLFLVDYELEKTAPKMLDDIRDISYFRGYKDMISNYQFMISPLFGGASAHIHHSAANTLVHGKKRWFLFPPDQSFYSAKQMYNWYKEDYPELKGIWSPIECVQQPGDFFYVPDAWGHATLYITDTVGIASLYYI